MLEAATELNETDRGRVADWFAKQTAAMAGAHDRAAFRPRPRAAARDRRRRRHPGLRVLPQRRRAGAGRQRHRCAAALRPTRLLYRQAARRFSRRRTRQRRERGDAQHRQAPERHRHHRAGGVPVADASVARGTRHEPPAPAFRCDRRQRAGAVPGRDGRGAERGRQFPGAPVAAGLGSAAARGHRNLDRARRQRVLPGRRAQRHLADRGRQGPHLLRRAVRPPDHAGLLDRRAFRRRAGDLRRRRAHLVGRRDAGLPAALSAVAACCAS